MLSEKYAPTTQKSLFHKNIVNHIRKWITKVECCAVERDRSLKQLLLVSGPVGCGKSTTVSILLKGFNTINLDPIEVRSADKVFDLANTIPGFDEKTLINIEKWNHKNQKEKYNVVVVDNIELCEKSIVSFVETVHNKRNINVPIILIGNDAKYNDVFNGTFPNYTFIEFNKPSLLELTKLVTDINAVEGLQLNLKDIQSIVKKAEFDARQVFYILEQLKVSSVPFEQFILSVKEKHVDIDLFQRIAYLLDTSVPFDSQVFTIGNTDPLVLTNGIFQNYITSIENSKNTSALECISTAARVMDDLSMGNTMQTRLFEDQCWEMYDNVAVQTTVMPSFDIKQLNTTREETDGHKMSVHSITPFKDISYNYMNSFAEVKRNCMESHFNPKFNKHMCSYTGIFNIDVPSCFVMVDVFLLQISILTAYFDKQKRGKNTSKQEKLDICNNITDEHVQHVLNSVVDGIYNYHLFEIDIDDVICHKKEYMKEETQREEYTKVDIRMFKRFLNIFSFHDTTKYIKPHVEAALKYKIFQKSVANVKTRTDDTGSAKGAKDIDSLTVELSNIWKF